MVEQVTRELLTTRDYLMYPFLRITITKELMVMYSSFSIITLVIMYGNESHVVCSVDGNYNVNVRKHVCICNAQCITHAYVLIYTARTVRYPYRRQVNDLIIMSTNRKQNKYSGQLKTYNNKKSYCI